MLWRHRVLKVAIKTGGFAISRHVEEYKSGM